MSLSKFSLMVPSASVLLGSVGVMVLGAAVHIATYLLFPILS